MSEKHERKPRKTKLVPRYYPDFEDENVETEKMPTKLPKTPKSEEESLEYFKLEPVEKSSVDIKVEMFNEDIIVLDETTIHIDEKKIEQNINENEMEHIKKEIRLENEINEVLKQAYNNLKSNAPIKNELQESIHNVISEDSDENVIDKSNSSLYSLYVNFFNDINIWKKVEIQDEEQTDNAQDTLAIDFQKKELADKNLLESRDKKPTNISLLSFNPDIVCSEKILNEVDVISKTSTNLVDRILAIEIRNCFGRCKFVALEESKQETMLQEAFQHWKEWQEVTNVRDVPLCYKCYVCKIAFWHLHPFREHIRTHESIEINIETQASESSIIAFETEVEFQTFHIDSDCWRCGNDFKSHPTLMHSNGQYRCRWCDELFLTCTALSIHKNVCVEFLKEHINTMTNAKSLQCTLCPLVVWQEDELAVHMELSHSVRSDLPIAGPTVKLCESCNQKYVSRVTHILCHGRIYMYSCLSCNRLFPTLAMLNMHRQYSNSKSECPICKITLLRQCMMTEHLTTHSENFQMLYRSVVCNKMCRNKNTAKDHNWRLHGKKNNKKHNLFDTIIVLKKTMECVTPFEIDSDLPCEADRDGNAKKKNNIDTKTTLKKERKEYIDCSNKYNNVFIKKELDLVLNDANDSINAEMYINTEPGKYDVDKEESVSALSDMHQLENGTGIVKEEIEELYEDDIIVLNNDLGDVNKNNGKKLGKRTYTCNLCGFESYHRQYKAHTELCLSHLYEADVIVKKDSEYINTINQKKIGKRKYTCGFCGFQSYHRQYKVHIETCRRVKCMFTKTKKSRFQHYNQANISCTKCSNNIIKYKTLKKYQLHLHKVHKFDKNKCPQCLWYFHKNDGSLVLHINSHVKNMFVSVSVIKASNTDEFGEFYLCRKCRMQVALADVFAHWETHLVLPAEEEDSDDVTMEDDEKHTDVPYVSHEIRREGLGAVCVTELIKYVLFDTSQSVLEDRVKIKTCPQCNHTFEKYCESKRHIIEHLVADAYAVMTDGTLQCQICSERFKTVDHYKHHMRDHGGLPIYSCELCQKNFSDSSNFVKHRKFHNLGVLICDTCGKKYQTKLSLIDHLESHNEEKPICSICKKSFYSQSLLNKHVRSYHNKPSYLCAVCRKRFESLKEKWDHMWLIHKQRNQEADCPICKEQFRIRHDVKKHLLKVHGKEVSYSELRSGCGEVKGDI